EDRRLVSYPFFRDEVDHDLPDPNEWQSIADVRGVTAYVLRHGRPLFMTEATFTDLAAKGEIDPAMAGDTSAIEWLGSPLLSEGRTIGLVAVQTYREDRRYVPSDLDLLTFVGQHIATALTRARAIEETRQRNSELAVVKEIGLAP